MNLILLITAAAAAMFVLELIWPAQALPSSKGWWLRAAAVNSAQALVVVAGAFAWDRWFLPLFALSSGSIVVDALLGYLTITFIYYWWHRARHEIPILWRTLHRFHHSAARLEVVTSFYKHPLEMIANGILSAMILNGLLGLDPVAAGLAVMLTGLAELFYHWNVATPHWLGYIIQRPESHRLHHQRGRHRQNYSDLPIWDMAFGTFDNPRSPIPACGFSNDKEAQWWALILGRRLK